MQIRTPLVSYGRHACHDKHFPLLQAKLGTLSPERSTETKGCAGVAPSLLPAVHTLCHLKKIFILCMAMDCTSCQFDPDGT